MNRTHKSLFGLLLLVGLATPGCMGTTPASALPSPYRGQYESTIALDSGKSGKLTISVADDASISGSLVVTNPPAGPAAAPFDFTIGSTAVTGTANSDGSFSMNGTDPNAGGFTIAGSLPTNGGTGSVTINAGGTNYTASMAAIVGGGSGSLTFTNSGASINASPFPTNPYIAMSTVGGFTALVAVPTPGDTSRTISLTLGPAATAGTTVDFTNNSVEVFAYGDKSTGTLIDWNATGGKIKVISRTASSIELQFIDLLCTSTTASGSFKINGTLKK